RAEVVCEGAGAAGLTRPARTHERAREQAREAHEKVPAPPAATAAPAAAAAAPKLEIKNEASPRSSLPAPRGEGQAEGTTPAPLPHPFPGSGERGSGSSTFVLAGLLAALGVGAFLYARRRQARTGFIKIVETASLGPKRSLVVAQVNGETLVLGSSEAG